MIRKLVILALTLMSLTVLVVWVAGYPASRQLERAAICRNVRVVSLRGQRFLRWTTTAHKAFVVASSRGTLDLAVELPLGNQPRPRTHSFESPVLSIDRRILEPVFLTGCTNPITQSDLEELLLVWGDGWRVCYHVGIQAWLLLTLTASYPLLTLARFLRRKRRGPNDCTNCGYDLTGNVAGRCSECGAEVERP